MGALAYHERHEWIAPVEAVGCLCGLFVAGAVVVVLVRIRSLEVIPANPRAEAMRARLQRFRRVAWVLGGVCFLIVLLGRLLDR